MKEKLVELIADLKLEEAEIFADELIRQGIKAQDLYDIVMEGLSVIGKKYENSECYIADLIVSGMIAKNIFAEANLHQDNKSWIKSTGKILFGTIYDDIHDIGKDLMIDALENKGIQVIDLGVDVKVEKFIKAVKEHNPDIIAVSCVMTNSIPYLQELGSTLEKENLLENRRFLLGGAVVNHDYIKIPQIDFMTNNFYEGIRYCEVYLEEKAKGVKNE
ncbi:cobalamin B12-binding domain-containing protein [Acetobacterium woodii]|uniref:Corrinoid protein MttC18 n=1 Tax=Acetobacterium woodii (strain ATCC 29683 / DSM 1030 / JCM 2381 / KCTC 1655 / WB1) TaxID=931626 RepID=H6LIN6_ACEWD|nr:cobalamin-dependent protein [Acetobacterium woodii]AFA48610.1 corrinoid protein MttC18 [Acetobacterium woodii DSM 1030]